MHLYYSARTAANAGLASALLAAAATATTGCTTGPQASARPAPVTLKDSKAETPELVAAVRSLTEQRAAGAIEQTPYRETLKSLAWRRSASQQARAASIRALLDDHPGDTESMLRYMLPTERSEQMIGYAAGMATEHGWVSLVPSFVRSLSRARQGVPEQERAAYAAIRSLDEDNDVAAAVFRVFTDTELEPHTRTAAWGLLRRIDPEGKNADELLRNTQRADDPVLASLQACASAGIITPATGEALDQLRAVVDADNGRFWQETISIAQALGPDQQQGMTVRHLAALRWARNAQPGLLQQSREELLDAAKAALDNVEPYTRTADTEDTGLLRYETLEEHKDNLVWADALAIRAALDAIGTPGVVQAVFALADLDKRDTSTEHGGVVRFNLDNAGTQWTLLHMPSRPVQRIGDKRYVAPPELFSDQAHAVFYFHLHAQEHDNREYAGPSKGDNAFVKRHEKQGIVFSFVSRDVLNADYFQPNGAAVSVGNLRRPTRQQADRR